jgi:hypothetical protein
MSGRIIRPMADTATAPPAPAVPLPAEGDAPPDDSSGPGWGRVLDGAGIAAGIVLVLIVADVWTDGRVISQRLIRWRQARTARQVPADETAPGEY